EIYSGQRLRLGRYELLRPGPSSCLCVTRASKSQERASFIRPDVSVPTTCAPHRRHRRHRAEDARTRAWSSRPRPGTAPGCRHSSLGTHQRPLWSGSLWTKVSSARGFAEETFNVSGFKWSVRQLPDGATGASLRARFEGRSDRGRHSKSVTSSS